MEACLAAALPEVDLREFVLTGAVGDGALRLTVDHPDGVSHDVCEAVTKALWAEGMGEHYAIEVWSPGPEPALRTRRHFQDALGHRVRIKVRENGRTRTREGILSAVDGEQITLTTPSEARTYPREAIRRAHDLDGARAAGADHDNDAVLMQDTGEEHT